MRIPSAPILREAETTYLDAVDGGLFLIYHNRIHVSTENDRNRQFILPLGRLTQVDNASSDACDQDQ